jgi:hypothetical protein
VNPLAQAFMAATLRGRGHVAKHRAGSRYVVKRFFQPVG